MAAAIPWLPSPTELPRIGAWTYRALLLAIVACLWFPATPLPLGGPNVVLSAVLVFLAGLYVLVSMAAGKGLVLSRTVLGLLAVIAAMLVWAGAVTVFTDTFTVPLVGQIAMGGAVLAATWVAVDTQRRARAVATLIAACTAISVLFGLAVIYIGDPLWRVWVVFANPETRFANDVLLGRIAGISPRVVNLAFQLVVATPLAVGLLLHNPCQEPAKRRAYDIAHYALALTLGVGIYFNTSRSAALAGAFGVAAVLASAVFAPRPDRRVALRRMPLIAVALAAGFAAVVAIHQAYAPDIVRPEEQEVAAECETPLGVISGALESGEVENRRHLERPLPVADHWPAPCPSVHVLRGCPEVRLHRIGCRGAPVPLLSEGHGRTPRAGQPKQREPRWRRGVERAHRGSSPSGRRLHGGSDDDVSRRDGRLHADHQLPMPGRVPRCDCARRRKEETHQCVERGMSPIRARSDAPGPLLHLRAG